ncbi:unnamed protein product, partial [Rotaria socialis]
MNEITNVGINVTGIGGSVKVHGRINLKVNIDYTNGGVRLIETVNLKPQHSTIAAFDLDKKFKDNLKQVLNGVKKEVNASENKKSENFMEMFRMDEAKLTSDQNKKVEALFNKFSKCISLSDNDVGKTSTLSHSIKLTRDTAIKQPICRINGELAEEVETQLQQLSDDGIIRPKLNKVGKFELKIMLQEGINLIPEAIKAFSNLFNCKVIVFEKRMHPIEFGDDSLPKICYLNSHNSLHYNLFENPVKHNQIIDPSPIILPEGRVGESVKNASVVINEGQTKLNFNKWTLEEIQIMQKSSDLLKLLKTFISMYPPGDTRVLKFREININLDNHRFVAIITLDAFIKGAIEVHISRAHCGRQVLKTILRETVWNPNDWRVVEDICHTCQICQRFKPPCNVAHTGFKKIVSACPFDLLSVDLMNLPITRDRFKCCLVAIDHFTKYLYAVPLKDKTAEMVVHTLERVVFQRCLQLPSRILVDNGPELDNTLYRQTLIHHNIQPIYSSPNHPESNGGVEKANQILKNILARFEGEQIDWVQILPEAVRIYNSSPHATAQRTPVSFFLERAHSLRNNQENLLSAAWHEPSHKFSPFMISQMVNETTPAFGKPIKVHHSHLRSWVPRPNYLAKFDLGGRIFPPIPQLDQVIPRCHYSKMYGNPSRMCTNSFLGFVPATPSVQPIAPGRNLAILPIVENLVEPQNEAINEPNISEPNIIETAPVASNEPIIIPEEVIINPIPVAVPIEPTIDNNLPNT